MGKTNITEFGLIQEIYKSLNMIKGFYVGYASGISDKCIIEYNGETFFVKLEKRPDDNMFEYKANSTAFDRLNNWE